MKNLFSKTYPYALICSIIMLAFIAYGEYHYSILRNKNSELEISLENALKELNQIKDENSSLNSSLSNEKEKNSGFEEQISKISSTVGVLEKIKNTDPQLLQKYSKVYFLNENYTPSSLTNIETSFLSNKDKPLQIHTNVLPHLNEMLKDAKDDGVSLKIVSAYRSFYTQALLKNSYKVLYGSGANKFSSDQGYSEHQLGTTVDLDTENLNTTLKTTFEKTKAYEWLTQNAYKYGFILSYPKNNTYYQFEPWHWRFVGVELARKLHNEEKSFYSADQREINTYLANFFD